MRQGQWTASRYIFYGNGKASDHLWIHKGIISAVKRVECLSDRMSHITLKYRCYDTRSECAYTNCG
jgi:hypothetical protein